MDYLVQNIRTHASLPEPLKINVQGELNMQGVKINMQGEPRGQQDMKGTETAKVIKKQKQKTLKHSLCLPNDVEEPYAASQAAR